MPVWLPLLQENRIRKGMEMHNRAVGSAQEKRDRWCDKAVDGNHCFWERYSLSHSSWHSWQVVSCSAAGKTAGTFQHSDAKKTPMASCWLPSSLCPWQFPALQTVRASPVLCQGSWRIVERFLKHPSHAQPQHVWFPTWFPAKRRECLALSQRLCWQRFKHLVPDEVLL